MGNLFSSSQNTKQKSEQTGTSQSNLWDNPNLQNFLQGYSQQFGNIGGFNVPANSYQTGAANAQTGVANNLAPGLGAAGNIASGGLSPTAYQPYYNQQIQAQVDPTIAAFNTQNQQALQNIKGNAASQGALGNRQGLNNAQSQYYGSVLPQQQAAIAGLYNGAYNNAQNTALGSLQSQLGGANALGSLTNANTGANLGLGNLGQNIWSSNYQNQIAPYSLYNQGVSGFTGLGGLSGQTTSGTSTGNSTTTSTPSTGSVIAGLGGSLLSGFGGGSLGGLFGGSSPAVGGYNWSPTSGYSGYVNGAFASGGAVDGKDEPPIHRMLGHIVPAVHALRSLKASGGATQGYDDGGTVAPTDGGQQPDFLSGLGKSVGSALSNIPVPTYNTGVWAGQPATAAQRFGAAAAQIGNGPFAPFGKAMMDQQTLRLHEMAAERQAAQLLGRFPNGQPTVEGQKLPGELAHTAAATKLLGVQSDKDYLLEVEKRKMQYAKELALAQQEAQFNLLQRVMKNQDPTAGTKFNWVPNPTTGTGGQ